MKRGGAFTSLLKCLRLLKCSLLQNLNFHLSQRTMSSFTKDTRPAKSYMQQLCDNYSREEEAQIYFGASTFGFAPISTSTPPNERRGCQWRGKGHHIANRSGTSTEKEFKLEERFDVPKEELEERLEELDYDGSRTRRCSCLRILWQMLNRA